MHSFWGILIVTVLQAKESKYQKSKVTLQINNKQIPKNNTTSPSSVNSLILGVFFFVHIIRTLLSKQSRFMILIQAITLLMLQHPCTDHFKQNQTSFVLSAAVKMFATVLVTLIYEYALWIKREYKAKTGNRTQKTLQLIILQWRKINLPYVF